MFEITQKGSIVTFKVSYHIPFAGDWATDFTHECNSEHDAQLLYSVLFQVFEEKVTKVRREAYTNGWKDKASKKPKNIWFSCEL